MSVEEKRQSRLYNVLPLSLPLCVLKNRKVYAHKSRSTRVYWTAWGALCLTCSVSLNPNNPLIQKIQFSFYRWTGWSTSSLTIRSVHARATASLTHSDSRVTGSGAGSRSQSPVPSGTQVPSASLGHHSQHGDFILIHSTWLLNLWALQIHPR